MKTFMRFAVVVAGILLGISLSSGAWAEDNFWSANLKFKVELRPGIAAYVDTIYMLNLDHPSGGKTLLAIPGMGLTASSYQPVVGQLFAVEDHSHSKVFSAAILVDYPGHAGSGLPKNDPGVDPLLFGNMILQDYVATMLGVMDQLPLLQINPDMLVGHCMGGIIIQMAQQQLLAQGTDLHRQYGIKDVVMLAPDPPGQVEGSRLPPGSLKVTPANDPILGTYLPIAPQFLMKMWFKTLSGVTVPGAPVEYLRDPSPIANESLLVLMQIFGMPPFSGRPMIDPGIFDSRYGTSLTVVAFSQDAFYTPEGQIGTYKYLTGDPTGGMYSGSRYFYLDTPDAVHGMYYSNPAALLSAGNIFK